MDSSASRWWSKETVALVTGANTGIGLAIVKLLAEKGLTVILTSRNVQKGKSAVDHLLKETGLGVAFHQLDVTSQDSITQLSEWIKEKFGGIDILINNAAIVPRSNDGGSDVDADLALAHLIQQTNYYGAQNVTQAMLPLFKNSIAGNRIANVSSSIGTLHIFLDEKWKRQLSSLESLTEELITNFLQDCLVKFEENIPRNISGLGVLKPELGLPNSNIFYAASKAALNAYTAVLARELLEKENTHEVNERKFFVNCMCPGLTSTTPMTSHIGHSAEVGADTAVWLALLPASACPTGKFFKDRQERSTYYMEGVEERMKQYHREMALLKSKQIFSDS